MSTDIEKEIKSRGLDGKVIVEHLGVLNFGHGWFEHAVNLVHENGSLCNVPVSQIGSYLDEIKYRK